MSEFKFCLNSSGYDHIPLLERLETLKKVGWDGFFTGWQPGMDVAEIAEKAKKLGLIYQSIHAPFGRVCTLWEEGQEGDDFLQILMDCVTDCANNDIPLCIIHAFIGFDKHNPTALGIERFGKLCDHADKLGVKLGFENTEGDEYLHRVLTELKDHPSCGFCWDTGHEMCYNHSRDLMALYGEQLVGTHLNDNLGITGKEITWHDDAHLLPFDGIANWQGIRDRLRRVNWEGPLTFELTIINKPDKHTHDAYQNWSYEEFLTVALERAKKFAAL